MSVSTVLTSPELDELVRIATGRSKIHDGRKGKGFSFLEYEGESRSIEILEQVERVYSRILLLRPEIVGSNSSWSFWIRTNRGEIDKFGNFDELKEDGDIVSYDEFETMWRTEYPDPVQWRRVGVLHFDNHLFFSLKGALCFSVNLSTGFFKGVDVEDSGGVTIVARLLEALETEVERCVLDPDGFHLSIVGSLPLSKRFGRIRRSQIWDGAENAARFDIEISENGLVQFEKMLLSPHDTTFIENMTAEDYFGYCEICYDAVGYRPLPSDASPKEKYQIMADNRDEGLSSLPDKDPQAFRTWLKDRSGGGQPFEICRGGNSTHISLYVLEREQGFQLRLEGFSMNRVVETAKMALALHARGIPFNLASEAEILRMINGSDFVGIVPDDFRLADTCIDFPEEDNISSYAHLWMIENLQADLVHKVIWYPIRKLTLNTSQ